MSKKRQTSDLKMSPWTLGLDTSKKVVFSKLLLDICPFRQSAAIASNFFGESTPELEHFRGRAAQLIDLKVNK